MDEFIEFEGKSIDEAIQNAIDHFQVDRAKLEVEIISEAKAGIFGLVGNKKALVKARCTGNGSHLKEMERERSLHRKPKGRKGGQQAKSGRDNGGEHKEKAKASRSEAGRSEADRPIVDRPKVDRPKSDRPKMARPKAGRSEAGRSEVDRPKVDRPKSDRPKAERKQAEKRPDRKPSERKAKDRKGQDHKPSERKRPERGQARGGGNQSWNKGTSQQPDPYGQPMAHSMADSQAMPGMSGNYLPETGSDGVPGILPQERYNPELMELVKSAISRLVVPIVGYEDLDLEVEFTGDRVRVTINDDEHSGLIIGREGQTLSAIQYLANRIVAKSWDEPLRIQLDTGDYRERQDDNLRQLAFHLAEKVRTTGRPQSTKPLSSYHRRVVHMALQTEEGIHTRSKGDGPLKRVLILPRREKRSGNRSGNRRNQHQ